MGDPTALLIDDSPLVQNIVRDLLEQAGYRVDGASGGLEACERVGRASPDVVVCDLAMPGMSGLATIRELRRLIPDVPIVVLTETYDIEAAVGAMRLGAVGYVRKGESDLVAQVDDARRQAQVALRSRRQTEMIERKVRDNVRYLVEHASQPMLIHRHGVILLVNQAMVQTFGVDLPDDMVGRSVFELSLPEDRARIEEQTLAAQAGNSVPSVYTSQRADGSPLELEVLAVDVVFQGASATLSIIQDLTERRQEQAARVASERMTAIGMVAAGAAHEINNPLAYMFASLTVLEEELVSVKNPDVSESLAALREGLQRIRCISRDLTGMSRTAQNVEPVNLRSEIELAARMAAPTVRPKAKLSLDLQDVAPVYGNGTRLTQVFLNLFINAAHAMTKSTDQNEIRVTLREEEGRVVAEVTDNGSGMSPQTLAKIFQPFFTTKAPGVGTGLGLHISSTIIAAHGGTLTVKSELGQGTAFRVSLPSIPS